MWAGRSPYQGDRQYVYPPTLALLLAPLSHARVVTVWHLWVATTVIAPLIAAGLFVYSRTMRIGRLGLPILYAFCSLSVMYPSYWPMSRELTLGQSDALVLPVLVASTVAALHSQARGRGLWIGLAALIKGWPALIGVAVLQSRAGARARTLVALGASLVLAPLLAVIFGGPSGLAAFVHNDFAARNQHLVSDSVWVIPKLLFTHTGLARPIAVAPAAVALALSVALAATVATLLVVALRSPGDPDACTWNVVFCLLLLLPVSHRQYALLALPILWYWLARTIERPARRAMEIWVTLGLVAWWLVQNVAWPYNGASAATSALSYSVPFAADLVACALSVMAVRATAAPLPIVGARPK